MLQHVYVDGATAKGECNLVVYKPAASCAVELLCHVRLWLAQDSEHAPADTCQMQV